MTGICLVIAIWRGVIRRSINPLRCGRVCFYTLLSRAFTVLWRVAIFGLLTRIIVCAFIIIVVGITVITSRALIVIIMVFIIIVIITIIIRTAFRVVTLIIIPRLVFRWIGKIINANPAQSNKLAESKILCPWMAVSLTKFTNCCFVIMLQAIVLLVACFFAISTL